MSVQDVDRNKFYDLFEHIEKSTNQILLATNLLQNNGNTLLPTSISKKPHNDDHKKDSLSVNQKHSPDRNNSKKDTHTGLTGAPGLKSQATFRGDPKKKESSKNASAVNGLIKR